MYVKLPALPHSCSAPAPEMSGVLFHFLMKEIQDPLNSMTILAEIELNTKIKFDGNYKYYPGLVNNL